MQFLHLLLPLSLVSCVDSGWLGGTDPTSKLGEISDGLEATIEKNRLAEISKKAGPTLTKEEKKKFDELAAKMTELQPENQEKTTDDQFEVNMKEGVTDYLFEGDIKLSKKQLENIERSAEGGRMKRQASAINARWTNNTVYYFFDKSINQAQKNAVFESIDYLTRKTCLKFVQSATATNRIRIFTGTGCWSGIGMAGGQQDLSLGGGCENFGTTIHEIIHSLGVWHMQHRYDRDNYVLIDTSPVAENLKHNFDKLEPADTIDSTPYEYGSVMHYSATTFSSNGKPAMIPLDPRYSVTIGSKTVSFYDIKMINDLYQCSAAATLNCQNGGVPNPFLPSRCLCPDGYGDVLCDKRPGGCGQVLNATANWQTTQMTVGNPNDASTVLVYRYCHHMITAPEGKKVQIKLTAMEKNTCHNGCGFNGIEPKVLPNPQITNPRYCCPAQLKGELLTSELNPTPVIAYNRNHYSKFTFQYRFVDAGTSTATTTKPTPAPKPNLQCIDTQSDCARRKQQQFCEATYMPLNFVKMACAATCGLCQTRPFPCYDRLKDECATFDCNGASPMMAEFNCAKTCGFCGPVYPKLIEGPLTTTVKTTTTPLPACHDTQADCASKKAEGWCDMKTQPFNYVKFACGVTCDLCDKKHNVCFDMDGDACSSFDCDKEDPMVAEFLCAKTCGLCNPEVPKTTVTSTVTTAAPVAFRDCHDTQQDCAVRKAQGFCEMKQQPFNIVKMACAATCGICGIPPSACYDMNKEQCINYDCKGSDPMIAEFYCAKTCGFCNATDPKTVSTPAPNPKPCDTTTTKSVLIPTTTAIPGKECHDTQKDCAARKAQGFCEMKQQPFNIVKMACAATCGICGIPHSPCNDMNKDECATYDCKGNDPMFAEFYCAKTCGFCGNSKPLAPVTTPTAPLVRRDCHDTQKDCATRKTNGICEMQQQPFNIVKMACAESCGLCGKTTSPCNDMLKEQCASYNCSNEDPMIAEFYCAKTCGFCEIPN